MFAFSQIIASGDKVSEVAKALENVGQEVEKNEDEDQAILAFSNTLPGNDDEPKKIEVDEETKANQMIAERELDLLNSNDATSAFGVLAQAQVIQSKVEDQAEKVAEEYRKAHGIAS